MHPVIAQELARARQADTERRRIQQELRAQAILHRRARPPSPSRGRAWVARTLVTAASRLAAEEVRRQVRST